MGNYETTQIYVIITQFLFFAYGFQCYMSNYELSQTLITFLYCWYEINRMRIVHLNQLLFITLSHTVCTNQDHTHHILNLP